MIKFLNWMIIICALATMVLVILWDTKAAYKVTTEIWLFIAIISRFQILAQK